MVHHIGLENSTFIPLVGQPQNSKLVIKHQVDGSEFSTDHAIFEENHPQRKRSTYQNVSIESNQIIVIETEALRCANGVARPSNQMIPAPNWF